MNKQRGLVLALSLGLVAIATNASTQTPDAAQQVPAPAPADPVVEAGRYAAVLGDCEACHTRPGGKPFEGGVALNTPFGVIYSANITPDPQAGIGSWTKEHFRRAMKHGKDDKGRNLYPAFSYPYYAHVKTADVDAIQAYLKSVPASSYTPPKNKMGFPFNVRFLVTFWNMLYLRTDEFKEDPKQSAEWNRGAYLVNGLGHCGACHTPKSLIGGDQYSKALQGGKLDNWLASDLTGDKRDGLGGWEHQDIVDFLKTGLSNKTNAYGSMIEVVRFSTSKMNDADLSAIATYLKSLPATKEEPAAPKPDAKQMASGKALYDKECASCHQPDGAGVPQTYPAVAGNANLQSRDPISSIHVVLTGSKTAHLEPLSGDPMPGFGAKMTDQQVADVLTYMRHSWGNNAASIDAKQVAKIRKVVLGEQPKAPQAPAARPAG